MANIRKILPSIVYSPLGEPAWANLQEIFPRSVFEAGLIAVLRIQVNIDPKNEQTG